MQDRTQLPGDESQRGAGWAIVEKGGGGIGLIFGALGVLGIFCRSI